MKFYIKLFGITAVFITFVALQAKGETETMSTEYVDNSVISEIQWNEIEEACSKIEDLTFEGFHKDWALGTRSSIHKNDKFIIRLDDPNSNGIELLKYNKGDQSILYYFQGKEGPLLPDKKQFITTDLAIEIIHMRASDYRKALDVDRGLSASKAPTQSIGSAKEAIPARARSTRKGQEVHGRPDILNLHNERKEEEMEIIRGEEKKRQYLINKQNI